MKNTILRRFYSVAIALSATFISAFGFADVPEIRYTETVPFKDGKVVESAWAHADVCTRFLEVIKNDVARNQTEARILFDDTNLYVTIKGYFDSQYNRGNPKDGMGSVNNYEFFIKMPSLEYIHVMVSEFGKIYVGRGKTQLADSGVTLGVEKGDGFWVANITLPFKTVGCPSPKKDMSAKVGIFRWNINVHEREKLWENRGIASGFTANKYVYAIPDLWADMTLTRKSGKSRVVEGPTFGARVNLFPNPDFNVPSKYSMCGKTVHTETMAMSGEWVLRGSGKDYQFAQLGARMLKPNTRYTLVVKARSFGAGSGLRIVQIARGKNGKTKEGRYVTMMTPLGPEMHEYFLPFTSAEDESWTMVFYKVDNRADDTGIDLASVRCYEGDISSFEVRKLVRPGRMAVVKGTEIPVKPNPIGRFAKKLSVLAFVGSKYDLREPEEIFAGTGVDLDVLLLEGKSSDIYSTYGDTKCITDRITKGEYNLVMVPLDSAFKMGKEMVKYIRKCVENGAGLYIEAQVKGYGELQALLKDVKNGKLGKGRVVHVKTAGRTFQYLPRTRDREDAVSLFPSDVKLQRVAADAWRTAVGDFVKTPAADEKSRTIVYAGQKHVLTKKLDSKGATIDWVETVTPTADARLGAFSDDGKVSSVAVEGDVAGVTLKWGFRDFSGRILAAGEAPAAAKVTFEVPRAKLYTNFGGIRLALVKGGREIDVRGEAVFVKDNDKKRLMDDYTPSMWPGDGSTEEMAQLEDIGIRSAILACAGAVRPAATIAWGFGVGSGWVGGGSTFCGWAQKSNVRAQNFNTKKWREEKAKGIVKEVSGTKEYGLLDYALCDEPNLSRPGLADEVDAHPENLAEYRVRMQKKYGTIAEYNRRHETSHKSFADLDQTLQADARKTKKYAEFIEWRNFNVDRWCEAIKFVSDNARAIDDAPFTMCNSFGQSALSGNDYWKLLTKAGLDFSTEYTAMVYFGRNPIQNFDEFIRSFRPDMRCWGWTGYFYTSGRARFMPWWTACHRYGGFAWYAATAPGYNVVDALTYARTVDGEELRQSLLDMRVLDGFGKVLTCWQWDTRDVALYYSHDSMLLSTILGTETKNGEISTSGPLHDYMYSRQGAQYTVEDLLYQHDFIAPEQVVEQNRLATCKALLMPRIIAMSDAEVAAVKAYLAKGGKVMCDQLPGDYDELGVKRSANPFAGLEGITVFGRNFDDCDKTCRAEVKKFLVAAGAKAALQCDDMVEHFGREAMHYVSGNADLYAVIRMGGRSRDDDALTFRFAKKGFVYDVTGRKYLGKTDRVTAKVKLEEGRAFAVLPSKIEGVDIASPAAISRGEDVALSFAIKSADLTPEYVIHVELVPPSGKARFHFKRNISTKNGKASFRFPVALNDEAGKWTLRAVESLTGVYSEKTLIVK